MGRGSCACGLPVPGAAGCICLGQRDGEAGMSPECSADGWTPVREVG